MTKGGSSQQNPKPAANVKRMQTLVEPRSAGRAGALADSFCETPSTDIDPVKSASRHLTSNAQAA
jgi:hypothetical protein